MSGNASILVYIVLEPKNHCVVPTIIRSFYNFVSAVKEGDMEFRSLADSIVFLCGFAEIYFLE